MTSEPSPPTEPPPRPLPSSSSSSTSSYRRVGTSKSSLSSHLSKANSVATDTLRRAISRHKRAAATESDDADDDDGGRGTVGKNSPVAFDLNDGEGLVVNYLGIKNDVTISYLIDLVLLLRLRLQTSSSSHRRQMTEDERRRRKKLRQQRRECLERLVEMKVALERMRPLEKKMRYQIDKLLALSTLGGGTGGGAGMFASVGRELEDVEMEVKMDDNGEGGGAVVSTAGDPLSFKPDLQGMMKMFEEEDGGIDRPNHGDDDDDDDDDDSHVDERRGKSSSSFMTGIALEKDDGDNNGKNNNFYQPPRLQSMPFVENDERAMKKRQRQLEKDRERRSRSELTEVIRSQLTDAPEEEDARGGALLGMQSESARRIAARDADIREFEERQMIRLSMGRKERGERKRMMRGEMSNLGAIAGGLGSLMAGVDDAFGGGKGGRKRDGGGRGGVSGDDGAGDGGSFKTMGMRKRRVDILEGGEGSKKKKKNKGGPSNTYQKSLYGVGSGGGGGMSRKKK
ncbi:hypothetical protein ACHAXA_002984 [Cyclostephanos tholiformis]|uniref:Uncharacterized protein n=1 Tax=Cyclostephanos tholiformis TaxID=382380 RepID=A0ABD3SCE1_9STRA